MISNKVPLLFSLLAVVEARVVRILLRLLQRFIYNLPVLAIPLVLFPLCPHQEVHVTHAANEFCITPGSNNKLSEQSNTRDNGSCNGC